MAQKAMRTQNDGFAYCRDCRAGEAHDKLEEISLHQLVEFGHEVMDSKNRWGIVYSFYQCARCGHIWQYREEGGPGGNNDFYTLLTHEG